VNHAGKQKTHILSRKPVFRSKLIQAFPVMLIAREAFYKYTGFCIPEPVKNMDKLFVKLMNIVLFLAMYLLL
jgi:hypothetical protein